MTPLLDAARIRALLDEFITRLGDSGERYDGVVVGGAALALDGMPNRAATVDVDTFGELSATALEIIGSMAEREQLPDEWLNKRAQQFMSPIADRSYLPVLFERGNARIRLMDRRTLLALKLRAGRLTRDDRDIECLLDLLEITSMAEAERVVDDYWDGEEEMAENSRLIVQNYLDRRGMDV